ncbi:hypothetical protein EV424DRAFT_1347171 [Suillus variegatus]|nr:hypothetical protein EV424DRAFT_1347171 [Suillus variegatus]
MRFSSAIVLAVIMTRIAPIIVPGFAFLTHNATAINALLMNAPFSSAQQRWDVRGHMNTIKGEDQSTAQPHTVGVTQTGSKIKYKYVLYTVQPPTPIVDSRFMMLTM